MNAIAEMRAALESACRCARRIQQGKIALAEMQATIKTADAEGQRSKLRELMRQKMTLARAVHGFGRDLDNDLESIARLRPALARLEGSGDPA